MGHALNFITNIGRMLRIAGGLSVQNLPSHGKSKFGCFFDVVDSNVLRLAYLSMLNIKKRVYTYHGSPFHCG